MKVSSEEQAHREAVLTVELDDQDVEPYLDRAYRQVVQRVTIPGFRKGKAPRRIVERMYGRGYLLNEALDFMVQDVTTKAVQQEALELGGVPSVSIEQFDPPSFKATVPLVPTVDLGDYQTVRVAKPEVTVTEEQVDEVLEQLRRESAVWEPADGPTQMGDLLNLTITGWTEEEGEERQEIVQREGTDYVPRSESSFPVPGFDDSLIGLVQDETKRFTLEVPEDFGSVEYAGKKAHFEVTVHSVKRQVPPPLDDEFAKGVGDGFESLDALRERIRENLRLQEEREATAKHQEEVLAKVAERATVAISPLIIDHELEHFLEEREEKLKSGRMTLQEYQAYLSSVGKSPEEIKEDARPGVEERLKRAHILREVARRQAFDVTDEEVDKEVESLAADAGDEADSIRKLFQEEERRDSVRRMLLNRKTIDYLTAIAEGEAVGTGSAAEAGQEGVEPDDAVEEAAEEDDEDDDKEDAGGTR